jgi:hypothetical protein
MVSVREQCGARQQRKPVERWLQKERLIDCWTTKNED